MKTEHAALATTAEGLPAQFNTVSVSSILWPLGILIVSLVMLKGVFHKGTAYLGILTGAAGIVSEILRPVPGVGQEFYDPSVAVAKERSMMAILCFKRIAIIQLLLSAS